MLFEKDSSYQLAVNFYNPYVVPNSKDKSDYIVQTQV
jgi:hypothetical protein